MATESIDVRGHDYGGTPCSGKGSVAGYIEAQEPTAKVHETGLRYRVGTWYLLDKADFREDTPHEEILETVDALALDGLADVVANRFAIVEKFGKDRFYQSPVSQWVSRFAPSQGMRRVVKTDLRREITEDVQGGVITDVLLDGRNLSAAVGEVEGFGVVARNWLETSLAEAQRRDCMRQGVALDSPKGRAICTKLEERWINDATRKIDRTEADADALRRADLIPVLTEPCIGAMAVKLGKQISVDTTSESYGDMRQNAYLRFQGARLAAAVKGLGQSVSVKV